MVCRVSAHQKGTVHSVLVTAYLDDVFYKVSYSACIACSEDILRESGVLQYCIALHCIPLHCIALHCITLYCIALYCIVLHCIALYCIVLLRFVLHLYIQPLLFVKNAQTSFKLFFRAVYEEVLSNDSTATGTGSATDIVRLYPSRAIIHRAPLL